MSDSINHPAHYTHGKYEVIDVIEDWKLGYHLGTVLKYIGRAGHKNSKLEDLMKARWFLERAIENEEREVEKVKESMRAAGWVESGDGNWWLRASRYDY